MLQIKNTLGGGKPEGLYAWRKNVIGSELKEINESVSTLPYNFLNGSAVVLNGEIHILGTYGISAYYNAHYKWDGSSWTSVSTLPYNFFSGSAVVLNGEIHILGGSYNSSTYRKHYKFDGSSWTIVSTLPYNFYRGSVVVLNNEIHILGTYGISTYYNAHYKWDGSSWTSVSTLPYNFFNGSAVVFNNKIHILGGDGINYHYEWNGLSWTSASTLPYKFSSGGAVVYNDAIHTLGSSNDSLYYKYHYLVYGYVPTYTFLDYIVSDKETAYPDGGEKDGYWYEKVVDGIDLKSIFNLTDIAVDTFTPTSNLDSINIPHSLGKVPKVALIVARYGDIKSSYQNQITLYGSITEFSMGSGARLSYLNGYNFLDPYINSADWDSSKIIPRSSSSNSLFASGVKYTLITMA